jgi:hypothetical protein
VSKQANISPGSYRHYKGGMYTVIGLARHSETDELLVVYRPEYGERALWVRPLSMFAEDVNVNGLSVPRFQYLGTQNDQPEAQPAQGG